MKGLRLLRTEPKETEGMRNTQTADVETDSEIAQRLKLLSEQLSQASLELNHMVTQLRNDQETRGRKQG